ncbi:unnamed protein product [Vitrella brassicaformis CCMP3155]|uniref:Uncharacterized protein n=3 Tax=Vitrella brassicaformis TaxID=1169539 RepID=A0A0G4ES28_VITBC|nr:unnamed protein product [Vitrella brassicaformis CCMP3155]|eukprot:CEM00665.1 unnamed protein product [Vitrella brassicaformis CCMP3155]
MVKLDDYCRDKPLKWPGLPTLGAPFSVQDMRLGRQAFANNLQQDGGRLKLDRNTYGTSLASWSVPLLGGVLLAVYYLGFLMLKPCSFHWRACPCCPCRFLKRRDVLRRYKKLRTIGVLVGFGVTVLLCSMLSIFWAVNGGHMIIDIECDLRELFEVTLSGSGAHMWIGLEPLWAKLHDVYRPLRDGRGVLPQLIDETQDITDGVDVFSNASSDLKSIYEMFQKYQEHDCAYCTGAWDTLDTFRTNDIITGWAGRLSTTRLEISASLTNPIHPSNAARLHLDDSIERVEHAHSVVGSAVSDLEKQFNKIMNRFDKSAWHLECGLYTAALACVAACLLCIAMAALFTYLFRQPSDIEVLAGVEHPFSVPTSLPSQPKEAWALDNPQQPPQQHTAAAAIDVSPRSSTVPRVYPICESGIASTAGGAGEKRKAPGAVRGGRIGIRSDSDDDLNRLLGIDKEDKLRGDEDPLNKRIQGRLAVVSAVLWLVACPFTAFLLMLGGALVLVAMHLDDVCYLMEERVLTTDYWGRYISPDGWIPIEDDVSHILQTCILGDGNINHALGIAAALEFSSEIDLSRLSRPPTQQNPSALETLATDAAALDGKTFTYTDAKGFLPDVMRTSSAYAGQEDEARELLPGLWTYTYHLNLLINRERPPWTFTSLDPPWHECADPASSCRYITATYPSEDLVLSSYGSLSIAEAFRVARLKEQLLTFPFPVASARSFALDTQFIQQYMAAATADTSESADDATPLEMAPTAALNATADGPSISTTTEGPPPAAAAASNTTNRTSNGTSANGVGVVRGNVTANATVDTNATSWPSLRVLLDGIFYDTNATMLEWINQTMNLLHREYAAFADLTNLLAPKLNNHASGILGGPIMAARDIEALKSCSVLATRTRSLVADLCAAPRGAKGSHPGLPSVVFAAAAALLIGALGLLGVSQMTYEVWLRLTLRDDWMNIKQRKMDKLARRAAANPPPPPSGKVEYF